ncbi:uncharacterized protein LOC108857513 isoform X1 [Raphanus sativus]|uniref:Uncharacterized protein LOC108857513 isoform X1 n=1 Tax=Raphanus sativus TaxID=3726 RepID=A0A9W3DJP9_RAPSA|nr:uncharacterized protein LOC108857513 isoform X1 [Raphanus sativus]
MIVGFDSSHSPRLDALIFPPRPIYGSEYIQEETVSDQNHHRRRFESGPFLRTTSDEVSRWQRLLQCYYYQRPNINAYQQTQGHVPIGTHQQKHEWLPTTKPVCFVDAAWNAASKDAGVVWRIISDLSPQALSGSQVIEDVSSPLVAEALALYKGVRKAIDLGFVSISFLSDCSTLIRAINNRRQIKEIYGILQDINSLSSLFVSVSFRHINRSQNDEADFLAKEALKAHCIFSSFSISSGPTTWA